MARKVLLVDDSQATRSFVEAVLEETDDYEVVSAASGFEALKLMPTAGIELIITDINMPDINGLEVIRYARTHVLHKTTPVLVISTEGVTKDIEKALALGATEYLVKPFTPEQLIDAVRRNLP